MDKIREVFQCEGEIGRKGERYDDNTYKYEGCWRKRTEIN
jgi:hypothetical protein